MNEYPACYDKAKRAWYRLLENVQLVKIPSLQVTRGAKSHPSEVPLQRQIDSEAVGRRAKKKIRPDEIVPAATQRRKDNLLASMPGVCIMSTSV